MDATIVAALIAAGTALLIKLLDFAPRKISSSDTSSEANTSQHQPPKARRFVAAILVACVVFGAVFILWPFLVRPDRVSMDEDGLLRLQGTYLKSNANHEILDSSLVENIALKSLLTKSRSANPPVETIETIFVDAQVRAVPPHAKLEEINDCFRYYKLQFIKRVSPARDPLLVRGLSRPSKPGRQPLEWMFPYDTTIRNTLNGQGGTVPYLWIQPIDEPSVLVAAAYHDRFAEHDWILVEVDDFTRAAPVKHVVVGITHLSLVVAGNANGPTTTKAFDVVQDKDQITVKLHKEEPRQAISPFESSRELADLYNAVRDLIDTKLPNLPTGPNASVDAAEIATFHEVLWMLKKSNPMVSLIDIANEPNNVLTFVNVPQ